MLVATTSKEFKILGVIVFSAFAVLSWLIPMEQPDDVAVVWTMRIGGICVASVFAISVLDHKPSLTQQEKMGEIPRFVPENCLVGGEELDDRSRECVPYRIPVDAGESMRLFRLNSIQRLFRAKNQGIVRDGR